MMRRVTCLLLGLWLAILLVGCSVAAGRAQPAAPAAPVAAPVFFADWQVQHLIPEERQIAPGDSASQATEVVRHLLAGPGDPHLRRTIPAGTRLLEAVTVADGLARVNLSRELATVQGASATNLAIDSIALSLTEIDGIDRVAVLVEGKAGEMIGDGLVLEVMGRPFHGDWPVLANPERVRYLQEQVANGEQSWRTDPARLLEWEGRMFGFTREQLAGAAISRDGGRAEARIPHRGTVYLIGLEQNPSAAQKAIWSIAAITTHQAEAGAVTQTVYFPDRQAMNLIPEARALSLGEGPEGLATAVVSALLAGPTDPYLIRLFPAGTRLLRPVEVEGGVATVDLSLEFARLSGSGESSLAVSGLSRSLTELPGVSAVQILVEGQKGAVVGNYRLDEPLGPDLVSERYYLDPDRVAWLQGRVAQEPWRMEPLQTLMWEGRAFGFTADLLKTATIVAEADGALASLSWQGRSYVIEMGRNPGEQGIWFIKGIGVE